MAERELKIISDARTTLNDVNTSSPRWTTQRLLELLNDAQNDLCKVIPLITQKRSINLIQGQETYRLPDNSVKLLRASFEGHAIDILSYDKIEAVSLEWETDTGSTISSVIVNTLSQQEIRPYPLIEGNGSLKVRYSSMPNDLGYNEDTEDTLDELMIATMWNLALKQYVIGMAFLDYGDESSVGRSQIAMGIYNGEKGAADRLSKRAFSKQVRTTTYQAKVRSETYGNSNSRYGR